MGAKTDKPGYQRWDSTVIRQVREVECKVVVMGCRFCGEPTPPPTKEQQERFNIEKLPTVTIYDSTKIVTPLVDYWPEGWHRFTKGSWAEDNRLYTTAVCPACADVIYACMEDLAEEAKKGK